MNEIQVFNNVLFGKVRTLTDGNDDIWFVGKDVADALGYSNSSKAVSVHVDEDDKNLVMLEVADSQNGNVVKTQTALINESGLYSLVLSSKLPSAKGFKHWITREVIPSIRKNGGYIANQENLSESELLAKALIVARRINDQKDVLIQNQRVELEELRPKALFADCVADSDSLILIGELAKLLNQNGLKIGRDRLFKRLREDGYIMKHSKDNVPTQRAMELGLFKIKETVITHADGNKTVRTTTKVTGKGQRYFFAKYLGEEMEDGISR